MFSEVAFGRRLSGRPVVPMKRIFAITGGSAAVVVSAFVADLKLAVLCTTRALTRTGGRRGGTDATEGRGGRKHISRNRYDLGINSNALQIIY